MKVTKLTQSLHNKPEGYNLLLIPHRISIHCITNAKTDECKRRLVQTAMYAAYEDMNRIHQDVHKAAQPINKVSLVEKVKEFFHV